MSHPPELRGARVRVPCSTSNLGAGFDCIGLALDRYLEASFEPGEGELTVVRTGTVAALAIPPTEDILVGALVERLARRAGAVRGTVHVRSDIPVSRGLGSSAAARVAGFALGTVALGEVYAPADAWILAARAEGHPDNVAPCVFGGLVAVVPGAQSTAMTLVRLPLSPAIGWAYAAPGATVSTARARAVLPATVGYAQAVDGLRRMAALLRGLETGDGELLAIGFDDHLHVPYRLPLIPGADRAFRAAAETGAWAVTISGSGSGLIAACPAGTGATVAAAMEDAFRTHDPDDAGVAGFAVSPDATGAQILPL